MYYKYYIFFYTAQISPKIQINLLVYSVRKRDTRHVMHKEKKSVYISTEYSCASFANNNLTFFCII